ncbi:MAG: DUF1343 domain-containing protein [bacterium]
MLGITKASKFLGKYRTVGLLINQASYIQPGFIFTLDYLRNLGFEIRKVFAPQHGLFPISQANMVPTYSYFDDTYKVEVVSLYEDGYWIDKSKLSDIECVFVDIQDVGARYYTYVWTTKLICDTGIDVVIFDRPNPLGAKTKEGVILKEEYFSFVGMKGIYNRHGMTIGEILEDYDNVRVVSGEFDKSLDWQELGLEWIPTSPNMPSLETVYFYVGFALFEGTNISEGRGTTYPFQVFGAPFINEKKLLSTINYYKDKHKIRGVEFLYHKFKPTFDKYQNQVCNGLKMVITDKKVFHSIKTFLIVLKSIVDLYPEEFKFIDPPYEYEYQRKPIDILWGDSSLREKIYNDFDSLMETVV